MKETRIICDVCGELIKKEYTRYGSRLFPIVKGVRYTKHYGIFGSSEHADICSECQKKLFKENA